MKHKILDKNGSFRAWGIGFYYEFDAGMGTLDVLSARDRRPLVYLDMDEKLLQNPLEYARLLEKSTQIAALMYSNNHQVDLSEVVDIKKLPAILASSARMARYCHDLEREDFSRFKRYFSKDFSEAQLKFKKIPGTTHSLPFYSARVETLRGKVIQARATKLHRILYDLSDKIIHELMTSEYSLSSQAVTQSLLKISSDLNTLGCALNDSFIPVKKILPRPAESGSSPKATQKIN